MRAVFILTLFAVLPVFAMSGARASERADVPEKYKWNLADLYPNEAAWVAGKEKVERSVTGLARFQGHLGDSAGAFHDALASVMDIDREVSRLATYASQLADQDRREARPREMEQTIEDVAVKFRAAMSFLRPEILALGAEKVRAFIGQDGRLQPYRPWLEDILRRAPHTLDPAGEKLLARAGNLTGGPESIYGIFTSADMPFPEVTLSTGEKVRLDNAGYTRWRAVPNRDDRMKVFEAFWTSYKQFERTTGTSLAAHVRTHVFNKETRNFNSCLEAALFNDNIPTTVYKQLIDDVHANLPTLHRYLKLRQKMMGLDELRYQDLYAPIVKRAEMKFTPEQAMDLTLAAVAPLGNEYVDTLRKGFESRWVDWLPTTGKRSGAYSTGAYGVHPYQLQNFTGLFEEVSTLAHESGHSMHTHLADRAQPYVTHDYATFVAEVASTLNENLLFHRMLDNAKDDTERLFFLGSYLDNLRATLFRQTLFAEFELAIHEMVERGEPLTGENASQLYLKLVREYFGHDKGICKVDDLLAVEWAYIHHFYYNFYVYQYSTSLIASLSIAEGIHNDSAAKPPTATTRDAYLKMLSAGSSKYPIDLLKNAGVDMTTSRPFQAAMREMNRIMDEIDKILAKKK
jgi:oligoendopeptidase F